MKISGEVRHMDERYLQEKNIRIKQEANDWEDAVRKSGQLLVDSGCAGEEYIEAIIEMVKRDGPYIVISPGLALPHARPEEGARREGISIVTLQEPVEFGHPENDPVDILVAFTGSDGDSHLEMLQALAGFLNQKENLEFLRQANSPREVIDYIKNREKGG